MSTDDTTTEHHLAFAKKYNGATWALIEKTDRTPDDDLQMVAYAMTSLVHWLQAGTQIHHQRGAWLVRPGLCRGEPGGTRLGLCPTLRRPYDR